jgi:antitoxin component YwqK of YwqJK toxin-antitoxin module
MKFFPHYRLIVVTTLVAAFSIAITSGTALAQEDAEGKQVTIQPYTGPPIFLDEREQVAPPSMVGREKITENFKGTEKIRVEREVAKFSDNHFEADGTYREYHPNGQLFVEGLFRKGRQQGEWTYWHQNGQVNRKATYKDGQPDGAWEIHRADGTLEAKRAYVDGKRDGEWITYDETGQKPLREEHYVDGQRDGVWKVWFAGGELKQQVSFQDGKRHGASAEWTEDGKKRGEINYADDKIDGTATIWLPDGRKIIQKYEMGRLVSEEKQ